MKPQRILIGTLVAGVSMFLLGWVIYGLIFSSLMPEETGHDYMRPEEDMIWWAMITSNICWGLLLAIILEWTASFQPLNAAKKGAILGLLAGLGFDFSMYSLTTLYSGIPFILADCFCYAILFSVCGALTGLVMGKIREKKL